jgi:hypothetical protein
MKNLDPVIREVRKVREAHAARFGYDLDAIAADLRDTEVRRDTSKSPLLSSVERYTAPRRPQIQRPRASVSSL